VLDGHSACWSPVCGGGVRGCLNPASLLSGLCELCSQNSQYRPGQPGYLVQRVNPNQRVRPLMIVMEPSAELLPPAIHLLQSQFPREHHALILSAAKKESWDRKVQLPPTPQPKAPNAPGASSSAASAPSERISLSSCRLWAVLREGRLVASLLWRCLCNAQGRMLEVLYLAVDSSEGELAVAGELVHRLKRFAATSGYDFLAVSAHAAQGGNFWKKQGLQDATYWRGFCQSLFGFAQRFMVNYDDQRLFCINLR